MESPEENLPWSWIRMKSLQDLKNPEKEKQSSSIIRMFHYLNIIYLAAFAKTEISSSNICTQGCARKGRNCIIPMRAPAANYSLRPCACARLARLNSKYQNEIHIYIARRFVFKYCLEWNAHSKWTEQHNKQRIESREKRKRKTHQQRSTQHASESETASWATVRMRTVWVKWCAYGAKGMAREADNLRVPFRICIRQS